MLGSAIDKSHMPGMCDAIAPLSPVNLFCRRGGKDGTKGNFDLCYFNPRHDNKEFGNNSLYLVKCWTINVKPNWYMNIFSLMISVKLGLIFC